MSVQADLCAELEPLLDSYHDNELDAGERQRVDLHLSSCQVCTGRLSSIKQLVGSLQRMPRLNLPDDFMDKLESRTKQAEQPSNVVQGPWRAWAGVGLAATAAIILLCLTFAARGPQVAETPKTQPAPQIPAPNQPSVATTAADSTAKPGPAPQAIVATQPNQLPAPGPVRTVAPEQAPASNNHKPDKAPAPAQDNHTQQQYSYAIAELPDPSRNSSFDDDLGIDTDEDGLYAINI